MTKNCLTCKYARKACLEKKGYIGCVRYNMDTLYAQPESTPSLSQFIRFNQSELLKQKIELCTGWVYTGAYPDSRGTGTLGLKTNGILLVPRGIKCESYEKRTDK